jgi:hypothetical protein
VVNKSGDIKDKLILLVWITGILLIISMLWIVTQNVQKYYLMRTVNSVFIGNNDLRRLSSPLQKAGNEDKYNMNLLGYWYTMNNSSDLMFVFSVFQDGIMIPLGAFVSPDGKVYEVIPLSAHAVYVFDTLPESILSMYIARIEGIN